MGKVIILTGKSGAGKDTICKELSNMNVDTTAFVSTTTRPMREGEQEGVNYYYVSKEDFERKIENNEFTEWRTYITKQNGEDTVWYYGSPNVDIDKNKDYAVILDMQGAKEFTEHYGKENCFVVYMEVNDKIREERAMQRGSFDKQEYDRRKADDDIKFSDDVVNSIANFRIDNSYDDAECIAYEISEALEEYEKTINKELENENNAPDLMVVGSRIGGYTEPPEIIYRSLDRDEFIRNELAELIDRVLENNSELDISFDDVLELVNNGSITTESLKYAVYHNDYDEILDNLDFDNKSIDITD